MRLCQIFAQNNDLKLDELTVLSRCIRKEFDLLSPYAIEEQDTLIGLARKLGLTELSIEMTKDALIPNERK